MNDIPWNHEASLIRRTGGGEAVEGQGILRQLVGGFLEMSPDQQHGLFIRASGPDWAAEYDEAAIRELAAHPEYTGAYGRYDSASDPDEPALADEADETLVESGVSGPGQA